MTAILTKLRRYLKEPYPYYYNKHQRLLFLLLVISILSFCFSYFFEPFETNIEEHKISSIWILVIHAFIPFPMAYLYLRILNNFVKDEHTWTLGKEYLHLSVILLCIGIVGFLIRDIIYLNPNNWSFQYLWEEIRNTFLIGTLLLSFVLPLNLERLINKHTGSLKKISPNLHHASTDISISLKSMGSNETFVLNIDHFLFAKVESNYTEIVTSSPEGPNKKLLRITLKELEVQLKMFPHIYKTHRSYLVNLNAIKTMSGNAQGYQLLLKNCETKIPVSRSIVSDFNTVYSRI